MKFMIEKTVDREMEIAEIHAEEVARRGLDWLMIGVAFMIFAVVIGVMVSTMLSDRAHQKLNERSNSPEAVIQQK